MVAEATEELPAVALVTNERTRITTQKQDALICQSMFRYT